MLRKCVPLVILILSLFLIVCSNKKSSNPVSSEAPHVDKPLGTLVINISVAPWNPILAKNAAVQAMDSVKVFVYSSSGSLITTQLLTLNGTRWQGSINVAAQNNMRVSLGYFGGSSVRYLGEKTGVNVSSGGSTTVDVTVNYMGLSVSAPDSASADFQVKWTSRPLATVYQLQQDTKADFSTATLIFAGIDTTYNVPISGKTSGQVYYYRARVNTLYGYGPWYSKGGAFTVGNISGTIIIDAPDLPDEGEGTVPKTYFSLGSSMDDVRSVQGAPTAINSYKSLNQIIWSYGSSSVTFSYDNGIVTEYSESPLGQDLKVYMGNKVNGSTFTTGSSQKEVIAAQGTPTGVTVYQSLDEIIWYFGSSSVTFSYNILKVTDYYSSTLGDKLNVR